MALAARAPDIILHTAIPLEAISDAPLAPVAAPPESASNHGDDVTSGVPKEITAQELSEATAARRGSGPDADPKADGNDDPAAKKDAKGEEVDVSDLPENLPGYAVREITKVRRASRQAIADAKASADAAAEKAQAAATAAEELRKELEALRAKAPEPVKEAAPEEPAADPKPARHEFDDPDTYDEAMAAWGIREGVRRTQAAIAEEKAAAEAEAARKAEEATKAEQTAAAERLKSEWDAKVAAVAEKHPDFNEVVFVPAEEGGPAVTDAMLSAIMVAPNGPDIAYYLATNVDESVRISKLPNLAAQMVEIGMLAKQITAPPARRARPAPIDPIDGGNNVADSSERELDMEAYAAKRTAELRRGARPFFPVH